MYYKTSIYLLYLLLKTSVLPCRGVEKASVVSEEEHCSVIWHMCLVSAGSCTSYGTLTHLNHLCGPQFPYLWNTHRLITFFYLLNGFIMKIWCKTVQKYFKFKTNMERNKKCWVWDRSPSKEFNKSREELSYYSYHSNFLTSQREIECVLDLAYVSFSISDFLKL